MTALCQLSYSQAFLERLVQPEQMSTCRSQAFKKQSAWSAHHNITLEALFQAQDQNDGDAQWCSSVIIGAFLVVQLEAPGMNNFLAAMQVIDASKKDEFSHCPSQRSLYKIVRPSPTVQLKTGVHMATL